tara:strand:- start:779 stop:1528 length:750 start_codon:yes stop_codon:yes gene_type:complete
MIWKNIIRYSISIATIVGIWKFIIFIFTVPDFILPAPSQVMTVLFTEKNLFLDHTKATIIHMGGGIGIGITLGILTGFAIAYSRTLLWLIEPYLIIFQSFPREALIPIIVVWLGFGHAPKIFNSAILSFFPMALITLNSLKDTRSEYIEIIKIWGAPKLKEYFYCRLPNAIYTIVGGLKITIPLGLIGAVLGEFMGGNEGLGHVIISSGANYRMDRSFASLVILSLIGLISLSLVRYLQDVVLKKYKQE